MLTDEGVYANDPRKLQSYWTEVYKFLHDVATSSPLNLFKLELRYSNPFWNAKATKEGEYADFALF